MFRESDKSTAVVDRVLDHLDRVTKRPKGWSARCPAHDDRNPSLSVGIAEGGGILVHCFAGCPRERILAALGLQERDLQPQRPAIRSGSARSIGPPAGHMDPGDDARSGRLTVADVATAKHLPIDFLRGLGLADDRLGVRIPYHDTDGTLVAIRTRLATNGDRFRWRRGIEFCHTDCGALQTPGLLAGSSSSRANRTAGRFGTGASRPSGYRARRLGGRSGLRTFVASTCTYGRSPTPRIS
jgi:hypothetical protein